MVIQFTIYFLYLKKKKKKKKMYILHHLHILLWLTRKINTDQIDSIMSAELPYIQTDLNLFEIVKSHMMREQCNNIN